MSWLNILGLLSVSIIVFMIISHIPFIRNGVKRWYKRLKANKDVKRDNWKIKRFDTSGGDDYYCVYLRSFLGIWCKQVPKKVTSEYGSGKFTHSSGAQMYVCHRRNKVKKTLGKAVVKTSDVELWEENNINNN
jgi:hypothetical protein